MSPDSTMGSPSRPLRRLVLSLAAAGLLIAGSTAARDAAADGEVVVRVAPPAPRVEVVPRAPTLHHVWAPGYWGWRTHVGHVWYGGHWVVGQPGYAWEPAHWSERGGYWHFVEGHWRRL
jgi:WXXGXW repeat (2 copies)